MAELADAADSKSAGPCALGGSIPPPGTIFFISILQITSPMLPFCYSSCYMLEEFIRYWWLPVTRGLALVAFGLLALFLANNMSLTLTEVLFRVSLVMLFGMY